MEDASDVLWVYKTPLRRPLRISFSIGILALSEGVVYIEGIVVNLSVDIGHCQLVQILRGVNNHT